MADAEQFNADQLAFWNGQGGHTWVARQEHTDITLAPVSEALLALAAPRAGERVLDVGCGCGASTLDLARAVGPAGHMAALDISAPMLAEGQARAKAAGIANVDWREADPTTAALDAYDLLVSNFGLMFFGDPVAAFTHMRRTASPGARMAFVCWRPLAENPWMGVPMNAVFPHIPPRPKGIRRRLECSPSPIRSASPRCSPRPAGRRRGSTSSTAISTSPPAAGWRRLWFSRLKSARSIAGCAGSRRKSSQSLPRPSARRWRSMWTAPACACAARCGWSAARPLERAPPG